MKTGRVLVTGVRGQLGHEVVKLLCARGTECLGVDVADFDLTDARAAADYIRAFKPGAVVHCAAYTAVDRAEDEPETCMRVNADGTKNIALVCAELGAKLVFLSTDYVFDDNGCEPHTTGEAVCPLNVYGLSKAAAEKSIREITNRHFIVRTSWVYGANGGNFVKTMLRLGREHDSVCVVCDQIGAPTYARHLAALLCDMLEGERYGIYHATNEGDISWYEFALMIKQAAGLECTFVPVTTEQYGAKALRPRNSRLDKSSLDEGGFSRLACQRDALAEYLAELGELDVRAAQKGSGDGKEPSCFGVLSCVQPRALYPRRARELSNAENLVPL